MKILIVDDELPARARLRLLLDEMALGEVVGEAGNGVRALEQVAALSPDVVLLDIRMPGMDGLEVARHLDRMESPPAVVFTTAYDSHALAAFEAHAVDYLLKPIRKERLKASLERAATFTGVRIERLEGEAGIGGPRTHVSANLHGNLKLVPVADVRFFRAEHKYVVAHHPGGELILDDSLAALESEFSDAFVRVHRNAIVAIGHARALERDDRGRPVIRFDGVSETVEVSRRLISIVRRLLLEQ